MNMDMQDKYDLIVDILLDKIDRLQRENAVLRDSVAPYNTGGWQVVPPAKRGRPKGSKNKTTHKKIGRPKGSKNKVKK